MEELASLVEETGADLLVLGSELQPVAGQPFLGNLVEQLVAHVHTSVAVIAAPRTWLGGQE